MRLLVLSFFPAFFPPASGGELRYFHLYSRLSKHFDVTLLSPTFSHHKRELIEHSVSFREHRIPKETIHDQLHISLAAAGLAEEYSALVCALSARHPNEYHRAYLELQNTADCIVHESPYMLDYDLLFGFDKRPRIYNSYNVESDLVSQVWKGSEAPFYVRYIEELEGRLVRGSQVRFAVSKMDADRFAEKFNVFADTFSVAENGVDTGEFEQLERIKNSRPVALFFGSLHPPNIEAANFVISDLAPFCPSVDFVIAGSCLPANLPNVTANVKTLGRVDDATRKRLFATSDVALNPMFSGGGTNLKALEYLAARIPMISTRLGARGLSLTHGRDSIISDAAHFAADIKDLLLNPVRMEQLANEAFDHVSNTFSWDAIARRTATSIQTYLNRHKADPRKLLLLLNDFSVANPTAGGEIRINRIYRHLGDSLRIALVCFTNEKEIKRSKIADGFTEIQIPKTKEHHDKEAHYYHWKMSAGDIVNYKLGPKNPLLQSFVNALTTWSDVIILTHPYMSGLLPKDCGKPVIYESLNVESVLKQQLLAEHPARSELVNLAEESEERAINLSSEIVTVSEGDRDFFRRHFQLKKLVTVVPNGADVPGTLQRGRLPESIVQELHGKSLVIFVGSAHPPNIHAANYITSVLAKRCSGVIFGLIGGICQAVPQPLPKNVILFGMLSEEEKTIVLELADIALNPMQSGSGSNLKLAEYFSQGIPTITTEFGARGYSIKDQREAVIAALDDFPSELEKLLGDVKRKDQLSRDGFKYAQSKLDWSIHAKRFLKVIDRVTSTSRRKRLLVITHRFTDPPLGGAETYLLELIRQLDVTGTWEIEVATLDIVSIQNEFHFSCSYTRDANFALPGGLSSVSVNRFPVDEIDATKRIANARQLFEAWMDESRIYDGLRLDLLPGAILLGGWYHPEHHPGGATHVWSSPMAHLRVKNVRRVFISGYAPAATRLEAALGGHVVSTNIDGNFTVEIPTHGEEFAEIRVANPYFAKGDPRPLGIYVKEILLEEMDEKRLMPLDVTSLTLLRQLDPQSLIEHLIAVAARRADNLEEIFQRTRGPNSLALEAWLDEYGPSFDVILAHCLPFKTFVAAAKSAKKFRRPLVAVPHMHIDDAFYHWKQYYDALKAASICLIHPNAATKLFFDRIGAKSAYLPFGMDVANRSADSDVDGFRDLYGYSSPFVLVLGRKAKAKRYDSVVEAVDKLRMLGHDCRVVMIGGDEDGAPLDPEKVCYLGRQPDGIVRAAIQGALCLVSMSDSESFGIVILEAWAEAKPVIVNSTCLAFIELVRNGEDGLHASPQELAGKIAFLLKDSEMAAAMGERGKLNLRKNFSWTVIGEKFNQALLNVVNLEEV
jgi:glycosyltransferase involved in cell wall biosynthesis